MSGAGEALAAAAVAALDAVAGLNGAKEGVPIRAAFPYALVDAGAERDWSHKSGTGREVRLMVTIRDHGERPARLRGLALAAEAAVGALAGEIDGWRLVTLMFLRSRLAADGDQGWAAAIDWRARLEKV